jgi:hypothetical protein
VVVCIVCIVCIVSVTICDRFPISTRRRHTMNQQYRTAPILL